MKKTTNSNEFNYLFTDSQGTNVSPIEPSIFDLEEYSDYVCALYERANRFWQSDSGVVIYRRFRVPSVFSYDSADMKMSLALQLGALKRSMEYKADIPNFLEPWYGIGTIASAFGIDYVWHHRQAPAIIPPFTSACDIVTLSPTPVDQTRIGKHTLDMIEYFLEQTKGRIPLSLTDTQSPINTLSLLVNTDNFILDFYDHPEEVRAALLTISNLSIQFTRRQIQFVGACLVKPGHGFASSRSFAGIGMSDDIITLLSPQIYKDFAIPAMARFGNAFGGTCFHSCGNWTDNISAIKQIPNLLMVDGAFTPQTDPACNPPEIVRSEERRVGKEC
jgi:hypothetical protein